MWWHSSAPLDFEPLALALAAAAGYLLGSIPFGLVFTRMAGLGDIRAIGSGNIGATNVLRTGNKLLALATVLADGGKGALVALVAGMLAGPVASVVGGCAAFIGHLYPIWLGFKGGKGVATYGGLVFAFAWPVGIFTALAWTFIAVFLRYASLAALVAGALAPFYFVVLGPAWIALPTLALTALAFWQHRANIRRLMKGGEPKIGAKPHKPGATVATPR